MLGVPMIVDLRETEASMHGASVQWRVGAGIRDSAWALSGEPWFATNDAMLYVGVRRATRRACT